MKKLLLIVLAALVLLTGCTAKQEAKDIPYDVQAFDWTIPYEYFEGQEKYQIVNGDIPFEVYFKYSETTLFGYNADIVYHYGDGSKKLHNISYAFVLKSSDKDVIRQVFDNHFNTDTSEERYPKWIDAENSLEITFLYNGTEGRISTICFTPISDETE